MDPLLIPTPEIVRFLIVLLRLGGIMIFAPLFGNASVPFTVRAAFALVASFVLSPSLPLGALPENMDLAGMAVIAAGEILSGVVLGFAASCVFAGMQFAGQVISFQLGFSLVNQIDPQTNVESSTFSFIHNYVGLLFFLLINGHHWFLLAVSESFGTLPVGGVRMQAQLMAQLLELTSQILVIGLRIAGPVIVVTVLMDLVRGILGRAAPQIQVILVGMPLKILVGLGCVSFSLYFLPRYLETVYSGLQKTLFSLVQAMS